MAGSWVTTTRVVPRALISPKSSRMDRPVALSRAPVGSSARRMAGELTRARAMAARELAGAVGGAVGEAHALEGLEGPPAPLPRPDAGVEEGQLDVLGDRQPRQEVELLEHEADLAVAQLGEAVLVQGRGILAPDQHPPGAGPVEAADEVHAGRLPRARGSHDGDPLARLDGEAQPVEGAYDRIAHRVVAPRLLEPDGLAQGLPSFAPGLGIRSSSPSAQPATTRTRPEPKPSVSTGSSSQEPSAARRSTRGLPPL